MLDFFGIIVTALATVVCAYISYKSNQENKMLREDKEVAEKRIKRRIRESHLSLKLMNANCELTVGTALAVKRGKANGELEEGLAAVAAAQKEYKEFLEQIALEDMEANHH